MKSVSINLVTLFFSLADLLSTQLASSTLDECYWAHGSTVPSVTKSYQQDISKHSSKWSFTFTRNILARITSHNRRLQQACLFCTLILTSVDHLAFLSVQKANSKKGAFKLPIVS